MKKSIWISLAAFAISVSYTHLLLFKAVKARLGQCPGELSGPVGTEVEEHHTVSVRNASALTAGRRLHELIGDLLAVGLLHPLFRIGDLRRRQGQGIIGPVSYTHLTWNEALTELLARLQRSRVFYAGILRNQGQDRASRLLTIWLQSSNRQLLNRS